MEQLEIKSYTLKELEKKEKLNYRTIKKRTSDYIPIRFDTYQAKKQAELGNQKNPYTIKYIRKKDLDLYFKNESKKNQ